MNKLSDIIKGVFLGIANIIPGFSGGTMAVVFGVYERLIYAISHFFEAPLKTIKDMWALGLGIILGLILAVFGVTLLLEHFPLETLLLFIGLIIGGIPKTSKEADLKENNKHLIYVLFGALVIILLLFLPTSDTVALNLNPLLLISLLIIGVITASSMVVPGVSGSLILLVFGFYDLLVVTLSDFIKGFLSFEFNGLMDAFIILMVFGIGVLVGIIVIAKIIEQLLINHKPLVYSFIVGLLIMSPLAVLIKSRHLIDSIDSINIISGTVLFMIGVFIAYRFGKKDESIKPVKKD